MIDESNFLNVEDKFRNEDTSSKSITIDKLSVSDKKTLIAIDAIAYPDIVTTRISAMLDLTAAIKNYYDAYLMIRNRDNAFEIYKKHVKEN